MRNLKSNAKERYDKEYVSELWLQKNMEILYKQHTYRVIEIIYDVKAQIYGVHLNSEETRTSIFEPLDNLKMEAEVL